jgi:hypothetical protein
MDGRTEQLFAAVGLAKSKERRAPFTTLAKSKERKALFGFF